MEFNNLYFKFFHKLSRSNNIELPLIVERLSENIVELAEFLRIAYISVNEYEIYKKEGQYDLSVVFEMEPYENGDKSSTQVVISPEIGVQWNQEEIGEIQLVADSLYIIGSRTALLSILKKTSMTDAMTGIPNDHGAHDLAAILEQENCLSDFCCFFINVKNFKMINKRYSSRGGDEVMKALANVLLGLMCKEGEFVSRLGGDNFLMLCRKTHMDEVIQRLQEIHISLDIVGNPVETDIEVYAGYVEINELDCFSDAINLSSIALTYSKRLGVPILKFQEEMHENLLHEKRISSIFADALKNREFEAYFQPKVDAKSRKICGAEALVRWIRKGKIIPPMEFIPILEREGTICQLDFYMLDKVCQTIHDWLEEGIEPVKVSVNFSRGHLHNQQLASDILDVIRFYNIPSEYIEVELTETADYNDFKTMEEFVENVRNEGISVSIDDFGTGYSSITMLRDLEIDTVKLDRSFVINLEQGNAKDRVMIEAVTHMIKALRREVLVEGVETKEQFDYLREVGCDVIQGFYFDRPMESQVFTSKLRVKHIY